MDPADWLNINCDLIAASLDKSRIGYKSAGVPSSSGRRDGGKTRRILGHDRVLVDEKPWTRVIEHFPPNYSPACVNLDKTGAAGIFESESFRPRERSIWRVTLTPGQTRPLTVDSIPNPWLGRIPRLFSTGCNYRVTYASPASLNSSRAIDNLAPGTWSSLLVRRSRLISHF